MSKSPRSQNGYHTKKSPRGGNGDVRVHNPTLVGVVNKPSLDRALHDICKGIKDESMRHSLLIFLEPLQRYFDDKAETVRQNALIKIDSGGDVFTIKSGAGQNSIVALFDDKGRPAIYRNNDENRHQSRDSRIRGHEDPRFLAATSMSAHGGHRGSGHAYQDMQEHMEITDDTDDPQQHFALTCDEINKRSMGKAVLKFCGNEGTTDSENKASLRRLLQAVISHIPDEKPHIWRDAEIKVFDDDCNVYTITAGRGHYKFVATFDGFGNPKVVKPRHGSSGCSVM